MTTPTLGDWKRAIVDPAFFAKIMLGIRLHPGQRRWLRRSTAPENVLVTGNRWGKSFVSAVKLLHRALFRIRPLEYDRCGKYRAVVVSITQDQADITFNEAHRLLRDSPLLTPVIRRVVHTPHSILTLGNGATIEARSTQNRGTYLLGNDYDLVIFDEVAFEPEPEYVVEEVIRMRLADRQGKLDLVSTPNGKNWLYRRVRAIADQPQPGYLQHGDSRDNPFVSADYLAERLEYFSEARRLQNIMGQFVDCGGEILKGEYIDTALARVAQYSGKLTSTRRYITGWDLARKQTATVGITVEMIDGVAVVVALERMKMFDWNVVLTKIRERQMLYPGQLVVDATGLGDVVASQLGEFRPACVIFTPATKAELLTNVELLHAKGQIAYGRYQLPDGPGRVWSFEDELRSARWDDNNECDSLMALALALWPLAKQAAAQVAPRVGRG